MVGTPAATVACSLSMKEQIAAGVRSRPGSSSDEPTMAPAWGSPHELAWNMGTMARTMSWAPIPRVPDIAVAKLCSTLLRWL